jgi:hypothetical protein
VTDQPERDTAHAEREALRRALQFPEPASRRRTPPVDGQPVQRLSNRSPDRLEGAYDQDRMRLALEANVAAIEDITEALRALIERLDHLSSQLDTIFRRTVTR